VPRCRHYRSVANGNAQIFCGVTTSIFNSVLHGIALSEPLNNPCNVSIASAAGVQVLNDLQISAPATKTNPHPEGRSLRVLSQVA
jgi:hypothetical protein